MKKRLLAGIATVVGATALAAGLPVLASSYKAPAADVTYNWSGFYVGGNVGYVWSNASVGLRGLPTTDPSWAGAVPAVPSSNKIGPNGAIGGAQIGYNYQIGQAVFGLESDISAVSLDKTSAKTVITGYGATIVNESEKLNALGTARVRVGFLPTERLLMFVTGGWAYGRVENSSYLAFPTISYFGSQTSWRSGWALGGGFEYSFATNWAAKLEYMHYDLGVRSVFGEPTPANPPFQTQADFSIRGDIVRVGLNYKLNGPISGRY